MAGNILLSYSTVSNGATSAVIRITMTYYGNGVSWNSSPPSNNCSISLTGYGTKYFTHSFTTSSSAQTMGYVEFTVSKTHSSQSLTASGSMVTDVSLGTLTASVKVSVSAKASYNVSYNANGGSGAPSAQTKWYGETLKLQTATPTRTGYTFNGWNTNSSGTGTNYSAGANYTSNSALTLYAKWTPIKYTVSYDANGGSNAPSSQEKTHGVNLTLTSSIPTRANYNFVGWATSSSGDVEYAPNGTYTANASITLYAVWVSAYQPPQILNQKAVRCIADGEDRLSGEYIKLSFDWKSGKGADGTDHDSSLVISGGLSYSVQSTVAEFNSASGTITQIVAISLGETNTATITITDKVENVSTTALVVFPKGGLAIHMSRPEKAVKFFGIASDDEEGVISEDYIIDIDPENINDPLVNKLTSIGWVSLISRFGVGIKGILIKILEALSVDYIVEEGTDGIWTYRKWNSGIVECWGLATISSLTWVSYLSTGLYYTNPNWEVAFPFSITNPRVNANIVKAGGNVGWVANANYSSEKALLSVVRNGNSGETSASITVKGRWK